ncbi:hypothetical protein [Agromyces cerinus]|uniref:Glutaminase n=1 Tax=Agromyces cerinus subsp. cerinus TaxID=232089 RepID=A0A1N6ES89_9MICO|nr:hypothetical protein [Agromyces cerinus]SIN85982.1 hypothetical protein SAMN05443544_1422 [Agromyces cerinus subsp. cerinus]
MTDASAPVPPESAVPAVPAALQALADAGSAAARELGEHTARDEALAEYVPERRALGVPRAARMTPIGRVWRLGVLLVDADGRLFATGRVVRAERPVRRSTPAAAIAEQRAYAAAAAKGGFAEGETVNFGAVPVDPAELVRAGASGPIVVAGDELFVRWSPAQPDALTPLDRYLADRVELLANPPSGA